MLGNVSNSWWPKCSLWKRPNMLPLRATSMDQCEVQFIQFLQKCKEWCKSDATDLLGFELHRENQRRMGHFCSWERVGVHWRSKGVDGSLMISNASTWGGVRNLFSTAQLDSIQLRGHCTRMTRTIETVAFFTHVTCEIHMFASRPWGPSKKGVNCQQFLRKNLFKQGNAVTHSVLSPLCLSQDDVWFVTPTEFHVLLHNLVRMFIYRHIVFSCSLVWFVCRCCCCMEKLCISKKNVMKIGPLVL